VKKEYARSWYMQTGIFITYYMPPQCRFPMLYICPRRRTPTEAVPEHVGIWALRAHKEARL